MKFILALNLIFSSYVHANIVLPYDAKTDALCFQNADPELAEVGIPILGALGVKQGICQGIAGVTAAFLENAQFKANENPLSPGDVHALIQQLIQEHRNGSRGKITIPGSKNLMEFCLQNKWEFMREAILYNAEIAATKIFPLLPELFTLKKKPLKGSIEQRALSDELFSIKKMLQKGQYPLMLYFKHVVMVTSFSEKFSDAGTPEIELSAYDSNHPETPVFHAFPLTPEGLPALENHMVWNLK